MVIKKFTLLICTLAIIMVSCTQNKVPEFDHYGVYLQNGSDYVELIDGNDVNPPKVEVDDEVVVYVYHAQAKTLNYKMAEEGDKNLNPENSPLNDSDEIVKLTAKVFGGLTYLKIDGQKEKFWFDVFSITTIEALKTWLNKNIRFAEKNAIDELISNMSSPEELENMSPEEKNEIVNQARNDPDALNGIIQRMQASLTKIENNEIIFHPFDNRVWLNTDYFDYYGNGKWKAFFDMEQNPNINDQKSIDEEIRESIRKIPLN